MGERESGRKRERRGITKHSQRLGATGTLLLFWLEYEVVSCLQNPLKLDVHIPYDLEILYTNPTVK